MSYSGIPQCARCSQSVYAAEQVIGPGRKVYHKPCLKCTTCNTRLDSYKLLEHNLEPYCKPCHVKNFGTVDLRHGNLPTSSPTPATRKVSEEEPKHGEGEVELDGGPDDEQGPSPAVIDDPPAVASASQNSSPARIPWNLGKNNLDASPTVKPLSPHSTGSTTGSPGKWRPSQQTICPGCEKAVYFAEQVKASGRSWHKLCLRCTECKTILNSSRLTEKDGVVYCHNCYGKLHGPQGGGYALAGRRMG